MTELSEKDGKIILRALKYARAMAYGFNFPATKGEVDKVIKNVKAIIKEAKESS